MAMVSELGRFSVEHDSLSLSKCPIEGCNSRILVGRWLFFGQGREREAENSIKSALNSGGKFEVASK